MSENRTIYNTFNLPDCAGIEWSKHKPTIIDLRSPFRGESAEWVCTFKRGRYQSTYYALFYETPGTRHTQLFCPRESAPHETDFAAVAHAIADLRLVQHSPLVEIDPLREAIGWLDPAVQPLYRVSENIRKSFPRFGQLLKQQAKNAGEVYLLDNHQNSYKIGHSVSATKRKSDLNGMAPYGLTTLETCWVPHSREVEKSFHNALKEYRLNGEWFALPQDRLRQVRGWYQEIAESTQDVLTANSQIDWLNWSEIKKKDSMCWVSYYYDQRDSSVTTV